MEGAEPPAPGTARFSPAPPRPAGFVPSFVLFRWSVKSCYHRLPKGHSLPSPHPQSRPRGSPTLPALAVALSLRVTAAY